ncbi:MAG: helix-turn-helix domain-containing protein [Micrococcaceae bacterium]|nr:helix-turn-helix domain-containing protein [Micrococcaceae bacterium]
MSWQALTWASQINRMGVLNTGEGFVLTILANMADEQWSCFPSQERLAQETSQSTRSVQNHIRKLRDLGLVRMENMYGTGRGMIGKRYYLLEHADLKSLSESAQRKHGAGQSDQVENRESTRPEEVSGDSQNRMFERPATSAGESQNRMFERPEKVSGDSLTGKLRHDSPENNDIFPRVPLKERARINHHHQSSDARAATMDDDDDDQKFYRRVDVQQLIDEVPGLSGYAHDGGLICAAVDVVLNRASGRIANPTAYVRKALSEDLYGVIGSAMSSMSPNSGSSLMEPSPASVVAFQATHEAGGSIDQSPSSEHQADVPDVDELDADAVPCTNIDHLHAYEPSARQLAQCNHCRLDPVDAAEDVRHVTNATQEQIMVLPERLQRWIRQFQPSGTVDHQGIQQSV